MREAARAAGGNPGRPASSGAGREGGALPAVFADEDEPFCPLRYDARSGQWRVGRHGLLPGDGLEVRVSGRIVGALVVLLPEVGWRLLTHAPDAVFMAPVEGLPARVV